MQFNLQFCTFYYTYTLHTSYNNYVNINYLHMSKYYQLAELAKIPTLTIYRQLMKKMKFYPSKKRYQIMWAIQEQFRDYQKLDHQQQAARQRKKLEMGYRHVLYYIEKNEELKRGIAFHNNDVIEPFAKTKQENIYF